MKIGSSFFIMPNRLTREEFIRRARQIHGWKYDYSKVEYVNNRTKICIICPEHGEFWQTPNSHLQGKGCGKCRNKKISKSKTYKTEYFIKRAKVRHNNKYDYSKTIYKGVHHKVCIICPEHGEFWQEANSHLQGQGCPKCGNKRKIKSHTKWNLNNFIIESKKIHGDKYDYSEVIFKDYNTHVLIICPKHGPFMQVPGSHLNGQGCKKCGYEKNKTALKLSQIEIIERIEAIWGDLYDLSNVEYNGMNVPIHLKCKEHGDFYIRPFHLIINRCGCPKCSCSAGEQLIINWLKNNHIEYKYHWKLCPDPVFFGRNVFYVDFYLPKLNTIIEFNGAQHYVWIKHWFTEERFQEQQDRDNRLKKHCKDNKIKLIEIPYNRKKDIDYILSKQLL